MRQVIDGKIYDTEKTELIHEYESTEDRQDFRYLREDLYRTCRGAYFIAVSTWDSDYIQALTEAEAINWLEEHGGTDALLEYFSEVLEEA